jgi:hypothetical protein
MTIEKHEEHYVQKLRDAMSTTYGDLIWKVTEMDNEQLLEHHDDLSRLIQFIETSKSISKHAIQQRKDEGLMP